MTEKLRNIEAAWSDVFLKKKKRVVKELLIRNP